MNKSNVCAKLKSKSKKSPTAHSQTVSGQLTKGKLYN